jgi:transposase-like protein
MIVTCVRWYLRFRLSYRDLASIAAELGIRVAPSTILRWVVRYTEEFVRRWEPYELMVGRSWRADETYIKVNGGWVYLYRAVDEKGRTVASYLSRKRDRAAARTFFRRALKRYGQPRTITLDGFEPSHSALRRMGMRNEFNFRGPNPVKIRSCQYLNNIVEIVFTQMTKTGGLAAGMGRDHVSDLHLVVDHQYSIDQQLHQSPPLREAGIG